MSRETVATFMAGVGFAAIFATAMDAAKASREAPPVVEVHVRDLGWVGNAHVYSITDLEKGTLCYVTDRDAIDCMPDQ